MKKKINKKKFKFSKYKVIRNFTIIGVLVILFFSLKSNAYNSYNYKTIIVTQGQTLWEIAQNEKNNNSYYNNEDIRAIIKEIKKINGLENSNIYPNQVLNIIVE